MLYIFDSTTVVLSAKVRGFARTPPIAHMDNRALTIAYFRQVILTAEAMAAAPTGE